MIATADMINVLKCLMLQEGYKKVQFYNLDIKCPELTENEDRFKNAVKYHMILSKSVQLGCDIDSDTLCNIEAFVKANPCICSTCTSTCPSFDITQPVQVACSGFSIVKVIDDP